MTLEQKDARRYFKSGFKKHDFTVGALLRGAFYLIAARAAAARTGLRLRELLALTWANIDFNPELSSLAKQ